MPDLTVHRHDIARFQDVVAVQQFTGRSMTGDVDEGIALVHHLRPQFRQPVNDPVDGILITWNQRARQQDDVTGTQLNDGMFPVRDPTQRGERFALRTSGDDHHLVITVSLDVFHLNQDVRWDVQVSEIPSGSHVAHHGTPHVGHLATVLDGQVKHLLHPLHVGGKTRDDQLLVCLIEHTGNGGFDILLQGCESWGLSVGGVRHEQIHPLIRETRETTQISDTPIEGKLIHLKIPGVQDCARCGAQGNRQTVGNGVIDREELKLKVPYSAPFAFLHLDQPVATDAMFFQLARHQCEGQLRTVNRNVGPLLEQIGHGTNVVLVAVGEHQGTDVVETI